MPSRSFSSHESTADPTRPVRHSTAPRVSATFLGTEKAVMAKKKNTRKVCRKRYTAKNVSHLSLFAANSVELGGGASQMLQQACRLRGFWGTIPLFSSQPQILQEDPRQLVVVKLHSRNLPAAGRREAATRARLRARDGQDASGACQGGVGPGSGGEHMGKQKKRWENSIDCPSFPL